MVPANGGRIVVPDTDREAPVQTAVPEETEIFRLVMAAATTGDYSFVSLARQAHDAIENYETRTCTTTKSLLATSYAVDSDSFTTFKKRLLQDTGIACIPAAGGRLAVNRLHEMGARMMQQLRTMYSGVLAMERSIQNSIYAMRRYGEHEMDSRPLYECLRGARTVFHRKQVAMAFLIAHEFAKFSVYVEEECNGQLRPTEQSVRDGVRENCLSRWRLRLDAVGSVVAEREEDDGSSEDDDDDDDSENDDDDSENEPGVTSMEDALQELGVPWESDRAREEKAELKEEERALLAEARDTEEYRVRLDYLLELPAKLEQLDRKRKREAAAASTAGESSTA